MGTSEPTPTAAVAAAASPGWRVIYLLRKAPWVREEPIAGFVIDDGGRSGKPLVLERGRQAVVPVADDDEYVIASPNEQAEQFVAEAKEAARRHRAWLAETRDARRQKRSAQLAVFAAVKARDEFRKQRRTLRTSDLGSTIVRGRLAWMFDDTLVGASKQAFGLLLAANFEKHRGGQVSSDALRARLGEAFEQYDLPWPDGGTISRLMRSEGLESYKVRGKVDGWTGLAPLPRINEEAVRPGAGEHPDVFYTLAAGVFVGDCVSRWPSGAGAGTPPTRVRAAFLAWCVWYRVKPLELKELVRVLRGVGLSPSRDRGGNGEQLYEGISVTMPKADRDS